MCYIYVFRPAWLPQGTLLREQALRACAVGLVLIMYGVRIIVVGWLTKVLVYDKGMKVAASLGSCGTRDSCEDFLGLLTSSTHD